MTKTKLAGWDRSEREKARLESEQHLKEGVIHRHHDWLSGWQSFHQIQPSDTIAMTQTQSTRASFEIILSDFKSGEHTTPSLPFNPTDFGQSEVNQYLPQAGTFDDLVQRKIYRCSYDFYVNTEGELSSEDLLNIGQIKNYAEEHGYEEWLPQIEEIFANYFDEMTIDRDILARAVEGGESVSPDRAREIYDEEVERIEQTIESVYGDLSAEEQQGLISAEKQEALWKIVCKIDG